MPFYKKVPRKLTGQNPGYGGTAGESASPKKNNVVRSHALGRAVKHLIT